MDNDNLGNLGIALLLIGLYAILTLAYIALENVARGPLREQAEGGDGRAGRVLHLIDSAARLRVTYQLSVILISLTLAAIIFLRLAQTPAADDASLFQPGLALGWSIIAALLLILVDLIGRALASTHSDRIVRVVAYPVRWLVIVLSPVVSMLLTLSRLIAGVFGSVDAGAAVTEEEIMTLIDAGHTGGTIEEEEKAMIYSVLQLDQTFAREVMVPRIDVAALDIETPLDEARATFIETGYSRVPVYEDNIDSIRGLLYAKDLLNLWQQEDGPKKIRDLMRPAYFVPETKRADSLLRELKKQKVHLAVVVDEYGGTAGLVTIEDLIEEIIGDIQDEFDPQEEAKFVEIGTDQFLVDAGIDLDDFNNLLDMNLPTEDSDTLGGLIYQRLGHVPQVGETLQEYNLLIRIESIEGRRIRKVHITRQIVSDGDDAAPDSPATEAQEATG